MLLDVGNHIIDSSELCLSLAQLLISKVTLLCYIVLFGSDRSPRGQHSFPLVNLLLQPVDLLLLLFSLFFMFSCDV